MAVHDKVDRNGPRWNKKNNVQKSLFIVATVGPTLIGFLLFNIYPNLMSAYYSLLKWDGISTPKFVGLSSYATMLQDRYVWRALLHNLLLMIATPLLTLFISLFLAYVITNTKYRINSFYRVLYFFPNVLSIVVVVLLWTFIYDGSFGLLNFILGKIGLDMNNFYWLGDTRTALLATVPPSVWAGVGFYVVIFGNAMSSVPKSMYEAAVLEGAGPLTQLFKITIPLINGVLRVCMLFMVLASIKGFEIIMVMTNGGPSGSSDVIGLYMFNMAFGRDPNSLRDYGYASSIGMLLFVILVVTKIAVDKFAKKESVQY